MPDSSTTLRPEAARATMRCCATGRPRSELRIIPFHLHARACKLDTHDRRAIIATLKQYFPYAVVIVGLKCRQIHLRGAVEYEPERIGTLEDCGGRRPSERQFESQSVTRLLRASDHDCIRVGLRPNGVIGGSHGW